MTVSGLLVDGEFIQWQLMAAIFVSWPADLGLWLANDRTHRQTKARY